MWIALLYRIDVQTFSAGKEAAKLGVNLLLLHAWLPFSVLSFNFVSWVFRRNFFSMRCSLFSLPSGGSTGSPDRILAGNSHLIYSDSTFFRFCCQRDENHGPPVFQSLVRIFEFVVGIATAGIIRHSSDRIHLTVAQWTVIETGTADNHHGSPVGIVCIAEEHNCLSPAAAYYFVHEGISVLWAVLIGVFWRSAPV